MKVSWMFGVFHLGIYLGKDGEGNHQVIDYTNDSTVNRVSLDYFLTSGSPGDLCRVRYSGITTKYTPAEVAGRANNEINRNDFGEFDTIFNNSEHFVTYCTFGKRFSYQVAEKVKSWWPFNYTIEIVNK